VFFLSVAIKHIILIIVMLSVIKMSAIMLNVVAPSRDTHFVFVLKHRQAREY